MEKVKKIGIIILIGLLIIIASLEGFYIIKSKDNNIKCDKNKTEIIYKGREFLVENISNELPDFIKLNDSIIINDDHTLLLNISTSKDIINSEMTIEYYDEDNNLVDKTEQSIGVLIKDNEFIVESSIPELNDKYSGKIKISMETNDFEEANYKGLDRNALKLTTNPSVDATTNALNINIQGTNPYEQKITELSGYVLLYEKDKIVNKAYFTNNEEIAKGASINFNTTAYPTEGDKITYDKIEVVINYLY